MTDSIIFQEIKGTGIIHLNRPKSLNALNLEMAELYLYQLNKWENDSKIKQVLLTGEGKALCTGGDIKSMFLSLSIVTPFLF